MHPVICSYLQLDNSYRPVKGDASHETEVSIGRAKQQSQKVFPAQAPAHQVSESALHVQLAHSIPSSNQATLMLDQIASSTEVAIKHLSVVRIPFCCPMCKLSSSLTISQGDNGLAKKLFLEILISCQNLKLRQCEQATYINLGVANMHAQNFSEAEHAFQSAKVLAKMRGDRQAVCGILGNLGVNKLCLFEFKPVAI